MNEVEINERTVVVNGAEKKFQYDVIDSQDFGDIVVVSLGIESDDPNYNRNVIALDPHGEQKWRIDLCPDVTGGGHDAYGGIYKEDGRELWVNNLNGMKYKVDKSDGSVLEKKFVK